MQYIIQVLNWILCIAGALITACHGIGCHIVALEEDKDIFNALVLSMEKKTPNVVMEEVLKPLPTVLAS